MEEWRPKIQDYVLKKTRKQAKLRKLLFLRTSPMYDL